MGNESGVGAVRTYGGGIVPAAGEEKSKTRKTAKPSVLSASNLVRTVEHYHDSLSTTKFEIVKSAFQWGSGLALSAIGSKALIIIGLAAIGITGIPGAVIVSAAVVLGLVVFCVYTKYQLYQREKALKEVDRFIDQFKWLDLTDTLEAQALKEKIKELKKTVKKYRSWFGDDRSTEERKLINKKIEAIQAELKTIDPDVMKSWCQEASTRMKTVTGRTIDHSAGTITWTLSADQSVTWTTREAAEGLYWIGVLLKANKADLT